MKVLVTGSAGHLGEALMRTLRLNGDECIGIDIKASAFTDYVGSVTDRDFVRECLSSSELVIHTATLHKPHVSTHSRQDFVDTNISGTLNLLEEAVARHCKAFIFTSTTSTFGDAMNPQEVDAAVWVTEALQPKPKNIYGVTKTTAEDLCQIFNRNTGLPCIVLRASRFFPEDDDTKSKRDEFDDDNLKVNELLFRRADIEDIVEAHLLAIEKATDIGFDRVIITATTPFHRGDAKELFVDAPSVLRRYFPDYVNEYSQRGWSFFPKIGRVYDNAHAREVLGWTPKYNFDYAIARLREGKDFKSKLARDIGAKGYHENKFEGGLYPVGDF